MKNTKIILEKAKQQEEKELVFLKEQIYKNSLDNNFRKRSIDKLINEILTKLTGQNLQNKRYIDEIPLEVFHEYILDLEKLYSIRKDESSNQSNNRNNQGKK